MGIVADSPVNSNEFPLQIQTVGAKRTNSVTILAPMGAVTVLFFNSSWLLCIK